MELILINAKASVLRNRFFWIGVFLLIRIYACWSLSLNEISQTWNMLHIRLSISFRCSFGSFRSSWRKISLIILVDLINTWCKFFIIALNLENDLKLWIPTWFNSKNFSSWDDYWGSYNQTRKLKPVVL